MKIHEFQAKAILKDYGIPIQDGYVIEDINQAQKMIDKVKNDFNSIDVVVKAQIHAGGRGKGGGVKFCPNADKALESCENILGILSNSSNWTSGQKVKKVFITQAFDIAKEYYVGITMDRATGKRCFYG